MPLRACVTKSGLGAISKANKNKINVGSAIAEESADIDSHFSAAEANAKRWDYYIKFRKLKEIYIEVHKVNEEEVARIIGKAEWLRGKISEHSWPQVEGRPIFVAPTAGVTPETKGGLARKLAMHKIVITNKGYDFSEKLSS